MPFQLAADDHQLANAEAVAEAGAGLLIGERDVEATWLASQITAWLEEPERLADMAARARDLGRPDAAGALADALDGLARAPAPLQREALA